MFMRQLNRIGISISLFFVLLPLNIYAQLSVDKGMSVISREKASAYVGFLAGDVMKGREAGKYEGRIAAEYLKSVLRAMGISPLNEKGYFQSFQAYSRERQKKVRYSVHSDSIASYTADKAFRCISLNNVLGCIEGKIRDEYVIIGAHYDHLGMDEALVGDKIYNGADDNASGVSAVLQIAEAFVASGKQPLRTVIFAFWDGEELGLLGSEYFVSHCDFFSSVKGYLNFDMIGRNNDEKNPGQVTYYYTQSYPIFEEWLKKGIEKYGLKLTPNYYAWDRPVEGSDNRSFARRDIPIIWYYTGGHPDYHQPSDHIEYINWEKLVDITRAAYLNLWNLANEEY
jgi:hypothetical protein